MTGLVPNRSSLLATLTAATLCAGCFSEQSLPVRMEQIVRPAIADDRRPTTTREWLRDTHSRLVSLLPPGAATPMLTEDLITPTGRPADVFKHFDLNPALLRTVWGNPIGLAHTAQATGAGPEAQLPAPPWPGFEDVWVPINDDLSISGRLGLAQRDGRVIPSDCIVILPGFYGNNAVVRTRDISIALREAGLHVFAMELRGAGMTDLRYPDVYYDFGVTETGDLLAVSEWLEDLPYVRRTGLIGFCWGANHGLLAAFEDARPDEHPTINPRMRNTLRPRNGRTHYRAGILAFSSVLRMDEVIEKLEHKWGITSDPVLDAIQDTIRDRARRKGFGEQMTSLRALIEAEAQRSKKYYPETVDDGIAYLRLMPREGQSFDNKLRWARVPVLIVHGANDPLVPAQEVADFMARLQNPNVAALILPGGGHVGFAPYARDYFYSLMLSFFDPKAGAAAITARDEPGALSSPSKNGEQPPSAAISPAESLRGVGVTGQSSAARDTAPRAASPAHDE